MGFLTVFLYGIPLMKLTRENERISDGKRFE